MSVSSPSTSTPSASAPARSGREEAPLQLTTEPPRPLGFADQLAMWANLGISLFGPITGGLVVLTTGSVGLAIAAVVVGCGIGALLLGASAVFGATTGAPAMVSLRGLFGRRGSIAPTVLNIAQNIGWATMEIIVISTAGAAVLGEQWRWPLVLLAGAAATGMAVRPLGSVRLLRKVMVWLVLAASVFLFVQVLSRPAQPIPQDGVLGFWPGVDLAIAGVISFAPLAADYSRHSRTRRSAFWGASLGYGLAAVAYYILGVLAIANLGAGDVIAALVALPAGAIALGILLVDEVDEAFANIYSTTMSVQNLFGNLDRRIVAVVIGVLATLDRRLPRHRRVPVVPVPDRLGLRAPCSRSRRWTSSPSAGSAGTCRRPPDCGSCRWSPGPAVSSRTNSSTPVRSPAGPTSGWRWRRRSTSLRRAGSDPRWLRSASAVP